MSEQNINKKESNSTTSNDPAEIKRPENSERQNWQLKSLDFWAFAKNIIDMLTFFVLALTLLVTIQTISEMKKDRNEAYKAVITANPVTETMGTSDRITKPDIFSNPEEINKPKKTIYITGYALPSESSQNEETHILVPWSETPLSPYNSEILFANIGPGMATNVNFSWDAENLENLYHSLLDINKEASYYSTINESLFIYFPNRYYTKELRDGLRDVEEIWLNISIPETDYSYMLPNCEEVYAVKLPLLYSLLFSEILANDVEAKPSIKLKVKFSDTQGIEYSENIVLTASTPSSCILERIFRKQSKNLSGITYKITTDYSIPIRK